MGYVDDGPMDEVSISVGNMFAPTRSKNGFSGGDALSKNGRIIS